VFSRADTRQKSEHLRLLLHCGPPSSAPML